MYSKRWKGYADRVDVYSRPNWTNIKDKTKEDSEVITIKSCIICEKIKKPEFITSITLTSFVLSVRLHAMPNQEHVIGKVESVSYKYNFM